MKRLAATTWWQDAPHNKRGKEPQWSPVMDHSGIDVHKDASHVCIRTETGQLIERFDNAKQVRPHLGTGAAGAQQRRETTARPHHQSGQSTYARASGGGVVAIAAKPTRRHRSASRMGSPDCNSRRQAHRSSGLGAQARLHLVCDVARWHRLWTNKNPCGACCVTRDNQAEPTHRFCRDESRLRGPSALNWLATLTEPKHRWRRSPLESHHAPQPHAASVEREQKDDDHLAKQSPQL